MHSIATNTNYVLHSSVFGESDEWRFSASRARGGLAVTAVGGQRLAPLGADLPRSATDQRYSYGHPQVAWGINHILIKTFSSNVDELIGFLSMYLHLLLTESVNGN